MRREKLVFIEHDGENSLQLLPSGHREQSPLFHAAGLHAGKIDSHIGTIGDEPFQPFFEIRKFVEQIGLEGLYGKQGNQAHHGAHPQRDIVSVRIVQGIVEKPILLIPKSDAVAAQIVHGAGNVEKMLPELAGHVFIGGIVARQFQCDG